MTEGLETKIFFVSNHYGEGGIEKLLLIAEFSLIRFFTELLFSVPLYTYFNSKKLETLIMKKITIFSMKFFKINPFILRLAFENQCFYHHA